MLKLALYLGLFAILSSCAAPRVQTIWKTGHPVPYRYKKILVVAIVPDGNDSLQRAVETQTVQQLTRNGYEAVSYVDGFSVFGISQSTTQEAAYFTLCEKGIDCVITLAKVNPGLTIPLRQGNMEKYPASFYFNHIWDYRELMASTNTPNQKNRVWECILFDLRSLEQQSVLQVNNATSLKKKNEANWLALSMIEKMLAEKIITTEINLPPVQRKGF